MRRKLVSILLSVLMFAQSIPVQAKELNYEDYALPRKIRCTCYTGGTVTATGKTPRYGIAGGKPDWFGCAVAIYQMDSDGSMGDFIGWWEVEDTGSAKTIQNGTSIDLYQYTLEECYDWVRTYGDYVYIQLIRAEG